MGRWRPLLAEETLDSLNVRDLSHFYIRYVLPGGTGTLYSNIGQSRILEAGTDAFDVTLSPDLSLDHCQYIHCTNCSATGEPYKFKPNEEKFHVQACLAVAGPATLRRLQMQTLMLTTCGTCAALAAQKSVSSFSLNECCLHDAPLGISKMLLPNIENCQRVWTNGLRHVRNFFCLWQLILRIILATANPLQTVASVSRAELQKVLEAKSKAEAAADVLLKLFQQNLASSGNVFTVPDIATIDRSIKNAKAKGMLSQLNTTFLS